MAAELVAGTESADSVEELVKLAMALETLGDDANARQYYARLVEREDSDHRPISHAAMPSDTLRLSVSANNRLSFGLIALNHWSMNWSRG